MPWEHLPVRRHYPKHLTLSGRTLLLVRWVLLLLLVLWFCLLVAATFLPSWLPFRVPFSATTPGP